MARITLFPNDNTASIDGNYAPNIDYTGINPTIHCVQWYDTEGWVEYDANLMTGEKPPNEIINSIDPYLTFVGQAEAIINAYLNPVIAYSTSNNTVFQGNTYSLGDEIVISTPNTQPPLESTPIVPPTPEDFQDLYWNGADWLLSPFPPSLSLAEAQDNLTDQVNASVSANMGVQSRIYSTYMMVTNADPGALQCADYPLTLADYQTEQDAKAATAIAQINAATETAQLYSFDPLIDPVPA